MRSVHRTALALTAASFVLAAPSAAAAAEQVLAVTESNRLVTFKSTSPGNIERAVPIAQLAPGDQIVGLDVRPANDQLFALGSSSRVYRINQLTGEAAQVGTEPFMPGLAGTSFGFDFNPTVDRIRLVSDTEQDLRLNPDNGQTAATDGNLAYAAGDPGAGSDPSVGAAAYTNSAPGADATTLYGIDSARDTLVRQAPPNDGTLNTVGPLGVDVVEPVAFDIANPDRPVAALRRAGQPQADLYVIDLASGRATPAAGTRSRIGTSEPIRAMTLYGTAPDDRTRPGASVAVSSTQLETRLLQRGLVLSVACDEACTVAATLRIGRTRVGTTTETIAGPAGRESAEIELSDTAKRRLRGSGTVLFTCDLTVTDAAGNSTSQTRSIRSQTLQDRRAG